MREDILQPSFADLELMRQGIEMDPVLAQVSAYVDQHAELIQAVEQQLEDGLKKPKTGRRGLTGAQVLLSWILMRIKNWDYRELAERITDGDHAAGVYSLLQQPGAWPYGIPTAGIAV